MTAGWKTGTILLSMAVALLLSGCGYRIVKYENPMQERVQQADSLIDKCYNAADELMDNLPKGINIGPDTPLIVTSFVNIDNLEESSTFGRQIAEIIASRLAQEGYNVKEVRLSSKALVVQKEGGEFILTRDFKSVRDSLNVDYVIVGTYGIHTPNQAVRYSKGVALVTARIVRINDNRVVSACDFNQNVSLAKGKVR